jgi:hypothetical protein
MSKTKMVFDIESGSDILYMFIHGRRPRKYMRLMIDTTPSQRKLLFGITRLKIRNPDNPIRIKGFPYLGGL